MQKSKFFTTICSTILLSLTTACGTDEVIEPAYESPCKDGCVVEANYICDMTCEDCGITYKKLKSNNSLLKRVNNIDFSNDASDLHAIISKMYQYLSDTYTENTEKKNSIVNKMKDLNEELNSKFGSFMMNDDYSFRYMVEKSIYGKSTWYDNMEKTRDQILEDYYNLMADVYFSPVGKDIYDLDQETEEWLQSYKTSRYEETQDDSTSQDDEPTRLDTVYSEIMNYDFTTGSEEDYYALANEYFTILSSTTPEAYNNYYEYQLAIQNSNQITIDKAKEYFDYFDNYGANYFHRIKNSIDKEKYSEACELVKTYSVAGKNYKGINYMQTVVNYLKTLKNDKMNAFDIVNNAHKDGYVFYGTCENAYGSKTVTIVNNNEITKLIVYIDDDNLSAKTQVHEIGHYLDSHRRGAVFNEFTSTTQEYLFAAYYFNKYNAKSNEEKLTMERDIIYEEFRSAFYYSLYEEIANAIYSNYSNVDSIFEDGISVNEYPTFFKKMFEKYGISDSTIHDYVSAIQHIMWGCGYDISYVVNTLHGINTFFDAVENYEKVVSNYMSYLCCDGSDTTANDMVKCGFASSLDSSVFTSANSNLNKLF